VNRISEKSRQEHSVKKELAQAVLVGGATTRGEDYASTVQIQELEALIFAAKELAPWYNPVRCS
jgi:hypothetical protein